MGIKEEKILYQMTAQGKKWWGDTSSPNMLPFGEMPKPKTGMVFSKTDRFILETLFYPFSVRFGYIDENLEKFKHDLRRIRPMIDQMFDFEKEIVHRTEISSKELMKSGMYLYHRTRMVERWRVLNEFHTYPDMLKPLKIK